MPDADKRATGPEGSSGESRRPPVKSGHRDGSGRWWLPHTRRLSLLVVTVLLTVGAIAVTAFMWMNAVRQGGTPRGAAAIAAGGIVSAYMLVMVVELWQCRPLGRTLALIVLWVGGFYPVSSLQIFIPHSEITSDAAMWRRIVWAFAIAIGAVVAIHVLGVHRTEFQKGRSSRPVEGDDERREHQAGERER